MRAVSVVVVGTCLGILTRGLKARAALGYRFAFASALPRPFLLRAAATFFLGEGLLPFVEAASRRSTTAQPGAAALHRWRRSASAQPSRLRCGPSARMRRR